METHRYIARFILEADTPLFVGSGQASLLKDALVQKDCNGFPMINGTSLAGVLRHSLKSNNWIERIFGSSNADNGSGSLLKVSSANMILNDSVVSEGLMNVVDQNLLNRFSNLPSRQHVRINDKGVAADKGLFDNEVVYKGTRFVFELELRGNESDENNWKNIIYQVTGPTFRIGSGTRNGYGSLKVVSLFNKSYDLTDKTQFNDYINFNPSFNSNIDFVPPNQSNTTQAKSDFIRYSLSLQPDSFFIFSEGFGDEEADNRPLEEEIVVYKNGQIHFEKQTVIPASSIKGAISHRVAFHYNKLTQQFADEDKGTVGVKNPAVAGLFGKAGKEVSDPQAGNVFINDFYFTNAQVSNNKILNHVAIDRFTGGAMDGALFSEKVTNLLGNDFKFDVFVKYKNEDDIHKALQETLADICKGLLPLGGMTTKGHGLFTGKLERDGVEIFNYQN